MSAMTLEECNSTLMHLAEDYVSCGCGAPLCDPDHSDEDYDWGLHIGAIFIIAVVSAAGALVPIAGRKCSKNGNVHYLIFLGKSAGVGIVLAVALIHMLQPAAASLTDACVPPSFSEDYPAYAYLFALLAALLMQTFEFSMSLMGVTASKSQIDELEKELKEHPNARTEDAEPSTATVDPAHSHEHTEHGGHAHKHQDQEEPAHGHGNHGHSHDHGSHGHSHNHGSHGHSHNHGHAHRHVEHVLADPMESQGENPKCHSHSVNRLDVLAKKVSAERVLQAVMLEVSFTIHSIFIGLTVGIISDGFEVLLIALAFHQFFEGISLGSRVADAKFSSRWMDALFVGIFALSAPLGILIGILAVHTINVSSVEFLLVQGIFDGICAGILLYAGFGMLLVDFPRESIELTEGKPNALRMRLGAILAIWLGAAAMAVLGLYL